MSFSYADALRGGIPDEEPVADDSYTAPPPEPANSAAPPERDDDATIEATLEAAGSSPEDAASQLWNLDGPYCLMPGVDYAVNVQTLARSYSRDDAHSPFISWVSDAVWEERPTYAAFKCLLDNYSAETGIPERVSSEERAEEEAFLSAVADTPHARFAQRWLATHRPGVGADSMDEFVDTMRSLWFSLYSRDASRDSCGFEHVFCGEIDDGRVKGLHNFTQVYVEEARGNLNYMGYLAYGEGGDHIPDEERRVLTVRFRWLGEVKSASSMFVGVSPQFEFILYTLMWLAGAAGHTVRFGDYVVRIKIYDMAGRIGSAFPMLIDVDDDLPDY